MPVGPSFVPTQVFETPSRSDLVLSARVRAMLGNGPCFESLNRSVAKTHFKNMGTFLFAIFPNRSGSGSLVLWGQLQHSKSILGVARGPKERGPSGTSSPIGHRGRRPRRLLPNRDRFRPYIARHRPSSRGPEGAASPQGVCMLAPQVTCRESRAAPPTCKSQRALWLRLVYSERGVAAST